MLDDYRSAVRTVACAMSLVWFACCGGEPATASSVIAAGGASGEPLEMQSTWLPATSPEVTWERTGGRVNLSHAALLRDETLASTNEWVLLDGKQQTVRIPRGQFVKYLIDGQPQDVRPTTPEEVKRCVVFLGAGNTALFADVERGTACRVELKPKPPPLTDKQERIQRAREIAHTAVMLPGAAISMVWLPEAPKFDKGKIIDGQETFSRGALVIDDSMYSSQWPMIDAKQKAVSIAHGYFVKYLTETGIEDAPPVTSDQVKSSVVFVGCGDVAIFIEVEKVAVCRIEAKPIK